MIMKTLLMAMLACTAHAWTNKWNYGKQFAARGHSDLMCFGETQPASCCLCRSIISDIEKQLDATPDDHEVDIVYRISEEKKKVRYARSEDRILEVLDNVCNHPLPHLDSADKSVSKLTQEACLGFVGEYEDDLIHAFFDNFTPAIDRLCTQQLQVCEGSVPSTDEAKEEL